MNPTRAATPFRLISTRPSLRWTPSASAGRTQSLTLWIHFLDYIERALGGRGPLEPENVVQSAGYTLDALSVYPLGDLPKLRPLARRISLVSDELRVGLRDAWWGYRPEMESAMSSSDPAQGGSVDTAEDLLHLVSAMQRAPRQSSEVHLSMRLEDRLRALADATERSLEGQRSERLDEDEVDAYALTVPESARRWLALEAFASKHLLAPVPSPKRAPRRIDPAAESAVDELLRACAAVKRQLESPRDPHVRVFVPTIGGWIAELEIILAQSPSAETTAEATAELRDWFERSEAFERTLRENLRGGGQIERAFGRICRRVETALGSPPSQSKTKKKEKRRERPRKERW